MHSILLCSGHMPRWLLAEACPQDIGKSLNDNFARHLGFTNTPIHKDNGCFDDLEPVLHDSIGQFHLEGVALRLDGVQINALQDLSTVAAKASSTVADGNAQHETCKN